MTDNAADSKGKVWQSSIGPMLDAEVCLQTEGGFVRDNAADSAGKVWQSSIGPMLEPSGLRGDEGGPYRQICRG